MAFKDKERQREYYNSWRRKRRRQLREEYFRDKVCVDCGAASFLEVDHVDPKTKISHRDIWFWKLERREVELAKCVPRCKECHKARHKSNGGRWRV